MATQNRNQLVPVQRQVTRGGRTFMQTFYVQPRHVQPTKTATIVVPDWHFKSVKEFDDEFQRINKKKDKEARHYLKEQLLKHVEENIGVTYDKLPDNADKAFVRNTLRAFTATKKHLAEGKPYKALPEHVIKQREAEAKKQADAKKQAEAEAEKKKKKATPPKKQKAPRKLPTKMHEAYQRATPQGKALALLTGIVPEDEETAKFIAQRVAEGTFGTLVDNASGSAKTPIEGNKDFERTVGNIFEYAGPVSQFQYRGMVGGVNNLLRRNAFHAVGLVQYDGAVQRDDLKRSMKKDIRFQQRALAQAPKEDDKALDKVLDDATENFLEGMELEMRLNALDANHAEVATSYDNLAHRLSDIQGVPPRQGIARLNRRDNVNKYYRTLLDRKGGSLDDVTYADLLKRQYELGAVVDSGDTDAIWDALDIDTMLEGRALTGGLTRKTGDVLTWREPNIGGETEAWLNTHALAQLSMEAGAGYGTVLNNIQRRYNQALVTSAGEHPEIMDKINPELPGMRDRWHQRTDRPFETMPLMQGIQSALKAGDVTRDEVVTLLTPALSLITKESDRAVGGIIYPDAEDADRWEHANGRPFRRMEDREFVGEGSRPGVTVSTERVSMDPFADLRYRSVASSHRPDRRSLFRNIITVAPAEETKKELDRQLKESAELKDAFRAQLADKEKEATSIKAFAYLYQTELAKATPWDSRAKRTEFNETFAKENIPFPDDDFLKDSRIPAHHKMRYALRLTTTKAGARESLSVKMKNYIAMENDLPGNAGPPPATKAEKNKAKQGEIYHHVFKDADGPEARMERMLDIPDSLELPEAHDLVKGVLKSSMGAVSPDMKARITEGVGRTHDRREHGSFKPKVHGVYEIKNSAIDEKFEEKRKELGEHTSVELYHGTSFATTQLILGKSGGFKVFKGSAKIQSGSMMGYGVYLANKSSKSAQYISGGFGRHRGRGTMFICEATLGEQVEYNRRKHIRHDHTNDPYDTVVADGRHVRNPEWLVKSAEQARPKYLIDYERVRD